MSRSIVARTAWAVAILAVLTVGAAAQAAPAETAKSAATAVLDINAATAEELTALPGIGPALAQRIVDFRKEHGPFRRVEDLLRVKGVGEKSFQKLRDRIKVSPAG